MVIGQHLKQSGMHWTADSADVIITLRCQQASRPHLKRTAHPPPEDDTCGERETTAPFGKCSFSTSRRIFARLWP